jgi:hypothetical protein
VNDAADTSGSAWADGGGAAGQPATPVPAPAYAAAPAAVAGAAGGAADRPELAVAGAFAGGLLAAMILKRLAR